MAQIKWLNTSGGDFATGANWMGGTVPGPADDALLTSPGNYTVTSNASETVNSLQIIQGVTLSITNGTFYAENGSGTGTDAGLISVGNNTSFEAGGTIAGTGTIQLNSVGNSTSFVLETANVTLSGGGKLIMGDNAQNYVFGAAAADTLVNVNDTISGAGQLGNNQLSIANQAGGIINATSATNQLVLRMGAGSATNAGLIEATGAGGLNVVGSTITQTGTGTIKAVGSGVAVSLGNGVLVSGGTLATSAGGVIQSVNNAEISGLTIASAANVSVTNNAQLRLDNTITNKGTIGLNSGGNSTDLVINTGTVTLTGGGKVLLDDNANNRIYGTTGSAPFNTLVNVNNTIAGSGQIGLGQLNLVNQAGGTINATGTAAGLTIAVTAFTNAGLIEDTNIGGLGISASVVNNTGTLGAFGTGATLNIYGNSDIVGGTLATSGGGVIETTNAGTLDGSGSLPITITTGSQISVINNAALTLRGSIVNHGTISLNSGGNSTDLILASPTLTLSGGGKVLLSDNANDRIYGSVGAAPFNTLVNVDNTIAGSGQLGVGQLTVVNQAAGIINSTGNAGMTISTGSGGFTNAGLIEDTGAGGVGISATVVTNTGTILATGALATIDLYNNCVIKGGTLTANNGGVFETINFATLDGSGSAITLTNGTTFEVLNNTQLALLGSIVNHGTIALGSAGNSTNLVSNTATVTLSGGGTVLMSDNASNQIYGAATANLLVNVNNTIVGSGRIGANQGSFLNQAAGIINSNGSAGLTIATGGGSFINAGLIEDTGSGGVAISATTITNTGTIGAFGAGSTVDVYNGSVIVGGLLTSSGGGIFETINSATLDGSGPAITIAAGTAFEVTNNTQLFLVGAIVNHGTIALQSGGNSTNLVSNSATVTLSGGGTLLLSDNASNQIYGAATTNVLVNVDNTIVGSGRLGAGQGSFVNQSAGIINSNGAQGLTIDTGGGSFANAGLIEDTGAGGIGVSGGATVLTNTGTIAAFGAGATVNVFNGATIAGGKLATSGGGTFQTTNFATLDGTAAAVTLTSGSQFAIINNTQLYLKGAIANQGTIGINSGGNSTSLIVNSPTVTLSGGGSVVLSDNSNNYIYASAAADNLINVGNTIAGAGHLGDAQLTLDNQTNGTINATGFNALVIDPGSTFTNEGVVEGSAGGGLLIQDATLTNTGTIASLSDSSVTIASSTSITNYTAGTLTGGTWKAVSAGTGHTSTLSIAAGPITTDAAHLVISGTGASITAGGVSVASSITTITAAGELDVQNGATFVSGNTLTDSGTILVSGSFSAPAITTTTKGVISANGGTATLTTTGKLTNNGTVQATSGGVLILAGGTLSSGGTIAAQAGGTVTITSAEKNANFAGGTLTRGTWQAIGSNATLAIGNGYISTDAATLTLSGAGSAIKSGPASRSLELTLNTVAVASQLNVLNGRGFASSVGAGIADSGTIALGGGTFSDTSLAIVIGGTFFGGGTLVGAVADNGSLVSSATPAGSNGTLTVTGPITGTGLLNASAGTQLVATAGFAVGSVAVGSGATLTGAGSASGDVTVGGTLTLGASGTLSAASLTVQAGGGTVSGAGIVTTGAVTDNGAITLSGGTLSASSITIGSANGRLTGNGTVAQSVASSGTIDASAGTLTLTAGESGGTIAAEAGGTLAGAGVTAAALTIAAGGSFIGTGSVSGITTDNGTLTASGGSLTLGTSVTGPGTAIIASGATLASTSALKVASVTFAAGTNEVLALGTPAGDTATILGFGGGTTIDLLNTTVTSFGYAAASGTMSLRNGTTTLGSLKFAGSYTHASFLLQSDGNGGTDIVFSGPQALSPAADLHAAVVATTGGAQAAGLTPTPVSRPLSSVQTQPSVGGSFSVGLAAPHPMDGMTSHFVDIR